MSEYKKQWPRLNEIMRKGIECSENKELIKFTTGYDANDYFCKKIITEEDLKTKWRSSHMKSIIRGVKKHLKQKGGA